MTSTLGGVRSGSLPDGCIPEQSMPVDRALASIAGSAAPGARTGPGLRVKVRCRHRLPKHATDSQRGSQRRCTLETAMLVHTVASRLGLEWPLLGCGGLCLALVFGCQAYGVETCVERAGGGTALQAHHMNSADCAPSEGGRGDHALPLNMCGFPRAIWLGNRVVTLVVASPLSEGSCRIHCIVSASGIVYPAADRAESRGRD